MQKGDQRLQNATTYRRLPLKTFKHLCTGRAVTRTCSVKVEAGVGLRLLLGKDIIACVF